MTKHARRPVASNVVYLEAYRRSRGLPPSAASLRFEAGFAAFLAGEADPEDRMDGPGMRRAKAAIARRRAESGAATPAGSLPTTD